MALLVHILPHAVSFYYSFANCIAPSCSASAQTGNMAIPVTIAVVFGLLMASCCHGVMVSTADEERAVNATRELIRRLETENPPRIINV